MQNDKKLAQLEEIVLKLEDKNISLADGIELFEKGLNLTKECLKNLNDSKLKITEIKKELQMAIDSSIE